MSYFKINAPIKDKYTNMGMVNISASFYLEEGDEGWEKYQKEHHAIVSVIPKEGYQGKVDEMGMPVDREDFNKWVASLPTEERDNPFCNHAIQFEANTTEEEILWCFEWALALTHQNYLVDDLHCKTAGKVVNQDIGYLGRREFYRGLMQIPEEERLTFSRLAVEKIASAESKVTALKEVDFTAVETIASYKVK